MHNPPIHTNSHRKIEREIPLIVYSTCLFLVMKKHKIKKMSYPFLKHAAQEDKPPLRAFLLSRPRPKTESEEKLEEKHLPKQQNVEKTRKRKDEDKGKRKRRKGTKMNGKSKIERQVLVQFHARRFVSIGNSHFEWIQEIQW